MKNGMAVVVAVLALTVCAFAADIAPDDLINAVDKMTPEQAKTLRTKLVQKFAHPRSEEYPFGRFSMQAAFALNALRETGIKDMPFSSKDLDLDPAGGGELRFMWKLTPAFQFGPEIGYASSSDSDLAAAGYSSANLWNTYGALGVNYEFLRLERVLLWADVSVGMGSVALETMDTPTGAATTLRRLGGYYYYATPQLGAAWRMNRFFSLFATGGYRFASDQDLREGGKKTDAAFDASGYDFRLGIGMNM